MDEAKKILLKAKISVGLIALTLVIIVLRTLGVTIYFLGLIGLEWALVLVVTMLIVQLSNLKRKVIRIFLSVVLVAALLFCSLIYLFVRNEFRTVRCPITGRTFLVEIYTPFFQASEVIGHYELRGIFLRAPQQTSSQGEYINVNISPFQMPSLIQIYANDGYILGRSAFPLRRDLNWGQRSFDEIIVTYQGDRNPYQPIRDIIITRDGVQDTIQYAYSRGGLAVPARVSETFAITRSQYQEIRELLSAAPLSDHMSSYQIHIRSGSFGDGVSITIFIDGTVFYELLSLRENSRDDMVIIEEPEPPLASNEFEIITDLVRVDLLACEQEEEPSSMLTRYALNSLYDRDTSYYIWGASDTDAYYHKCNDIIL